MGRPGTRRCVHALFIATLGRDKSLKLRQRHLENGQSGAGKREEGLLLHYLNLHFSGRCGSPWKRHCKFPADHGSPGHTSVLFSGFVFENGPTPVSDLPPGIFSGAGLFCPAHPPDVDRCPGVSLTDDSRARRSRPARFMETTPGRTPPGRPSSRFARPAVFSSGPSFAAWSVDSSADPLTCPVPSE